MIFTNFALAAVAMMTGVMANPTPAEAVAVVNPPPATLLSILTTNGTLEARDSDVEKRQAGAGIHHVYCGSVYSMVVYCPNDSNCGSWPQTDNACYLSGIRQWEGGNYGCTFPSGVTFSWTIRSDAQSRPNFSQVGTGSNGFNSWRVFKDNRPTMFRDGNGNACQSIYYSIN